MTDVQEITEADVRSDLVSRKVGGAAEAVLDARDDAQRLKRTFEHSPVPMLTVDDGRRYLDVNRPARLWFRLSLDEMRTFAIGDLTPAPSDGLMEKDELGGIENDGLDTSSRLTPREIEVLALAAEGLGGPKVAEELVVSPAMVNAHFKNIYAKLRVRTRAAAVAKAMRLGVIR
jgi:DNA-binding CsgD family transcriptional regulator